MTLAHRRGRFAAWLQRAEVELRLRQHEGVLAGEVVEFAPAQQRLPRQRTRMTRERIGHRLVERLERNEVGTEIDVALGHAHAEQRKRGEQPARGRVGDQLAEERLRVDGAVHQVGQLLRVEEQQALLAQEGRCVRPADRVEMRVILRQRVGQRGGGGIRLLRLARIDDRHQQIVELRELLVELVGLLPPRQAAGEHAVGVGADIEMRHRVEGGQRGQQQTAQRHGERVATAEFGQSDNQAVKHHPGRVSGRPASAGGV